MGDEMTTKTFVIAALALFVAANVSALTHPPDVTVRASQGEIIYVNEPQSNSFSLGKENGDCNLAGGLDNCSKIFLVKFDLPPTNLAVMGDAGLSFASSWSQGGFTFSADIWTVVSNWTDATVGSTTWETFNGAPVAGSYSNGLGEKVGTLVSTAADAFTGGRSPTGTLDGAVIQNWLDNPGDNIGLALVNNPADGANWCIRSVYFATSFVADQNFELYYDVVPEPVFLPILAGLGLIAWRRMR
jgi:hypothetical protein